MALRGYVAAMVGWAVVMLAGSPVLGADVSGVSTSALATTPPPLPPALVRLIGTWQRPDGGYVLAIKGVFEGGALQAAYYNMGLVLAAEKRRDEARAAFRRARELGADSPLGQAAVQQLKQLGEGG